MTGGIGDRALGLCEALAQGDLLYLADDEHEAESLADAVAALMPGHRVIFVPASDTLPGDGAPASPANIGQRIAALRRLRRTMRDEERPSLATIMSGEAAARRLAEADAFDAVPPTLRPGDDIGTDAFAEQMQAIGYVADDRVDEPGEIAVRGEVVDIFPADAGGPFRIDIAEGRVSGIRRYDPVTQLGLEDCDTLEIGRAVEPEATRPTHILAHLKPGRLILSPKAEERRQRFARLARDAGADDAVPEDEWHAALAPWTIAPLPAFEPLPRFAERRSPLTAFVRFAKPLLAAGHRLLLVGGTRDVRFLRPKLAQRLSSDVVEAESLADALSLPEGSVAAMVAPIDRGAQSADLILLAAADLLGSRARIDEAPEAVAAGLARSAGDIRAGDIVAHTDHGVARVIGLEPAPGEANAEAIALEYAGGNRRLVPARDAGSIWRYGADADAVKLDRLDGASWAKRRTAIDEAIARDAKALLALAAERAELDAPVLDPDPALYERFVAGFPFNETADQARAIQAVRDDLASGRPMDRLVIGDVGYGKTEVALRAAALAALAGHQVVLAAPTTVLVRQHLQTFARRFEGTGIAVASLSRLSGAAERKRVKAGLADGSIGVVIGTGAVMGKGVSFARLGLVIIDEEQRFGAADKARLRGRPDVHLMAMSATPIPRTLHRAMIGLQQMSQIATPPARRQPIRTSLVPLDDQRIRTALMRERSRRGQSFVVVPRIADLAPFAERIARIAPDLIVIEAHGKLPAADLDAAMVRFADGEGDVLLATNIIEAGLDVPRANTMIVWHADRFGLAQLHQLRGRVGRGNRRGQVMLITEGEAIAARTMKRLRTLATYDRLGAGFDISAADLEQRGAGDPLSETQAGHMKLIGVDLYQHLFEAAIKAARGQDEGLWRPEINGIAGGALPPEWIPDGDIRLGLYVRLARIVEETDLEAFEAELADRFGPLPPAALYLVATARLAILARGLGLARIDAGPAAIALTPRGKDGGTLKQAGLTRAEDRWLLKERTADEDRGERVLRLLEDLSSDAGDSDTRLAA